MADLGEFSASILQHVHEFGGTFQDFPDIDLLQEELELPVTGELDAATTLALAEVFANNQPGVNRISVNSEDTPELQSAYFDTAREIIDAANELVDIQITRESGQITYEDGLGNRVREFNRGTSLHGFDGRFSDGTAIPEDIAESIAAEAMEVAREQRSVLGSILGAANEADYSLKEPSPFANAHAAQEQREL